MAIQEVISVLERLVEAHEQLIALSKSKRESIMSNDVDQLSKTMKQENKLIQTLLDLERERIAASARVLEESGIQAGGSVTLRQVMSGVSDHKQSLLLAELEDRLRVQLKELRASNDLNQQLIQHSIDFINLSIELIVPQHDDSYIYRNPSAYSQDNSGAGIYNKRV